MHNQLVDVVELADTLDLESSAIGVRVRVSPSAFQILHWSHGEVVITPPCQGGVTGSIPVGAVKFYIVRLAVRSQLFHSCSTGSNPVRCIVMVEAFVG